MLLLVLPTRVLVLSAARLQEVVGSTFNTMVNGNKVSYTGAGGHVLGYGCPCVVFGAMWWGGCCCAPLIALPYGPIDSPALWVQKHVFLYMYTASCHHCQELEPELKEVPLN